MAKLSSDATSVTVEKGDTLWYIAEKFLGSGSKYKQLAAINNIPNPDLIYVGQVVKLTNDGSSVSLMGSSASVVSITQFGLQSNSDNTLFVTWAWSRSHTENYKVEWCYSTGDGVWFIGSESTTEHKQSTYSIPSNAITVRVRVKPISKTYTKNDKETSYWVASWSTGRTYMTSSLPPKTPPVPTVEIDDTFKLTAKLENLDVNATGIQFQVVKDNLVVYKTAKVTIKTAYAAYSCKVLAGSNYKVRCRSYRGSQYSDWSDYSSAVNTVPASPGGFNICRATSETSVYLAWVESNDAKSYDIEYTTDMRYFGGSDGTTTISGIETAHYEKTGLESGDEYFFRVRAVNDKGKSGWSGVRSVVIGTDPAAPTTWSSTTTAIVGETLNLYWVHNTEDGSSQTYAELELYINGVKETYTIANSTDEDEQDKTSVYTIDTSSYVEGTIIQWRVRTAGITKTYGDWSIQRTVDVYAPPTLSLNVTTSDGDVLDVLESFPFYVKGLAGPNTQTPIGYQLTISANDIYETVDSIGNPVIINKGQHVYSKYFDTTSDLSVELSAGNVDLENNISYTVSCTVSMNSGLTAEASTEFIVAWTDDRCEPNAEISIDEETLAAYVSPYCVRTVLKTYKVERASDIFSITTTELQGVYGEAVYGAYAVHDASRVPVYYGVTADGDEVYYCEVEETVSVEGVLLSVYRREFDGSFTELAADIENNSSITVTDPHPSLDYARYRIVAKTVSTGAVSYYDMPGYSVGEKAIVIQWDENWSNFDVTNEDELEQPAWSGSMLKLPWNIDVSDKYAPDVSKINYIGRKRPVAYYGTQLGESSSWKVEIDKKDKETLYALRRLSIWMGNVYVREPSGSGYWANITVSFNQTHCKVTIPVTLDVTRVEGGA